MTRDDARSLFSDYLEGTLDAPTRDAMQAFLAATPDVAAELIAFERTVALLHRLPPREPTLDLWREFAPRVEAYRAERRLSGWQRVRENWGALVSQLSAGVILWTRALADRTHARLEHHLLRDPLAHGRRDQEAI